MALHPYFGCEPYNLAALNRNFRHQSKQSGLRTTISCTSGFAEQSNNGERVFKRLSSDFRVYRLWMLHLLPTLTVDETYIL